MIKQLQQTAGTRVSAEIKDSVLMTAAMIGAGGFDFITNLISGKFLDPVQFSVFVSVVAILQILVHVTNVIRNVVAFYAADLSTKPDSTAHVAVFFRQGWRWAWRWGLLAAVGMALLSPLIARALQLDSTAPLWAASLALVMLFVRPITDGTLQGVQHFVGLATVQLSQSMMRAAFALILILLGWQAFGAVLALPLATSTACLIALWFLQPWRAAPQSDVAAASFTQVSWRYSTLTLVGMLSFALLVNMDALMVKALFSPKLAGDYGPAVTLGKINLFVALALGMVLFPKAVARHAEGRNARPLLLLALGATLVAGLTFAAVLYFSAEIIVPLLFQDAYATPRTVLGLIGIATTLYAMLNIWLSYALSRKQKRFVVALAGLVIVQAGAIFLYHETLVQVATTLVAFAAVGNLLAAASLLPHPGQKLTKCLVS